METNASCQNFSEQGAYPCSEERTVAEPLLFLTVLLGIMVNGFVITAALCSAGLRTTANAFVINLALADMLMNIFAFWYFLISFKHTLESFFCKLIIAGIETFYGSILYTLTLISVNRYIAVTKSRRLYLAIFKQKFVAAGIVTIWGSSIVVSVFRIATIHLYNAEELRCDLTTRPWREVYISLAIVLIYYIVPVVIITGSYFRIYLHIRRHNRLMKSQFQTELTSVSSRDVGSAAKR
ncbi:Melatonin receptor type 1C [Holothuria leucospilota]|uniref:Melatonin receptor type 1C n=1 Tax=Holothuria leucospilota TaxID=206669 RepID=A0A9Q1CB62_HOLLE|nr:Melatonin receptor type 1C [Holothuria leucospilota]